MRRKCLTTMTLMTLVFFSFCLCEAEDKETSKMEEAIRVLEEIASIPEKSIPPALLNNAAAVAVIPHVIRAGFVVGGRYGWGVMSVREGGGWNPPTFVSITGGSVGYQIGVEAIDVVLVFKNEESIQKVTHGKFTLGVDAGVAAGPVGRSASASTDVELKAEVYSYSRSKGLFAGAALQGAALQIDRNANANFYGKGVTADQILSGRVETPKVAVEFNRTLSKYAKP